MSSSPQGATVIRTLLVCAQHVNGVMCAYGAINAFVDGRVAAAVVSTLCVLLTAHWCLPWKKESP